MGSPAYAARSPNFSGRMWGLYLLLLSCVVCSSIAVVHTTHQSRVLLNELQELEKTRNDLQVEWGQLLLEQSSLVSQGRIEDVAVSALDMEVPDMKEVVVIKRER